MGMPKEIVVGSASSEWRRRQEQIAAQQRAGFEAEAEAGVKRAKAAKAKVRNGKAKAKAEPQE